VVVVIYGDQMVGIVNQYLLENVKTSPLIKYLNINTIPRYITIDAKHKIIDSFAPRPNGSIYKCELEVSNKQKALSKLNCYNAEEDISFQIREKCMKCSLFPICNWGCTNCHIMKGNEKKLIELRLKCC
jgi:radical SAM protein with 4Fe4S-binding SPASM domain